MKYSNLRRWVVRLAWSAVWLVTLICLVLAFEGWRGYRAWTTYQAELIAKGDSPSPDAVIPPHIPDAENFAATPVVQSWFDEGFQPGAYDLAPSRTMVEKPRSRGNWQRGRVTNLEKYADDLENGHPSTGSASERILRALSRFDPILEELRIAGQRSGSRFPVEYEKGYAAPLPHLGSINKLSIVLSVRAEAELQMGEMDGALKDCLLTLRLCEALSDEPSLVSILVECSSLQAALNSVWQGTVENRWSAAELIELDAALARVDLARHHLLALRGERNLAVFSLEKLLRTGPSVFGMSEEGASPNLAWLFSATKGWIYQNQVNIGRMLDDVATTVDGEAGIFYPERSEQVAESIQKILTHRRPTNFLAATVMPVCLPVVSQVAAAQANVDLARVAIALERHRLLHSSYPESLGELDPAVLPVGGLPLDAISGEPFRYYREADAYTLYSKGWDRDDDGGVLAIKESSTLIDVLQGDWPWPSRPQ